MSSKAATAAKNTRSAGRSSRTAWSLTFRISNRACPSIGSASAGSGPMIACPMAAASSCAASTLTSGRRVPSSERRASACHDVALGSNGTKNAMRSPGNSKSSGMMPTMVMTRARPD